jgi:hypothetical protein
MSHDAENAAIPRDAHGAALLGCGAKAVTMQPACLSMQAMVWMWQARGVQVSESQSGPAKMGAGRRGGSLHVRLKRNRGCARGRRCRGPSRCGAARGSHKI